MISRSTDVLSALKSRQRGFLMNPLRFGGGGGGGGGGPVVESLAHSYTNFSTSTITPTMPSGIAAGNFLVAIVYSQPTPAASGWTVHTYNVAGNISVMYRVATGSDSLTITGATNSQFGVTVFRISNANSLQHSFGWASSTTLDTPAVTPSGGPRDYLALSCIAVNPGDREKTATAYPTGFADYTRSSDASINAGVAHVTRASINASTIDPSAWTFSASVFGMYATVAIWKA